MKIKRLFFLLTLVAFPIFAANPYQRMLMPSAIYIPDIRTSDIHANDMHGNGLPLSLSQKIYKWWKQFWNMETLSFTSIHMRYWINIFGVSLLQYVYLFFLLLIFPILIIPKRPIHKKFRIIFFRGIGLFFFVGIRNIITYTWIVDQGYVQYTKPAMGKKRFFFLWDYIAFTDKIRKELWLDVGRKSCSIYVDSLRQPFFSMYRQLVYLKPCAIVASWSRSDYVIYYEKPIPTGDIQKPILIKYNSSYLVQNKDSAYFTK